MNKFGGNWTENKIDILVEYAKAYLTIMNKNAPKYNWKLLYFDGFAGSGFIKDKSDNINMRTIIGAAKRILELDQPMAFDMYYFVEKDGNKATYLYQNTKDQYPDKNVNVAHDDCNKKIEDLSSFLKNKGKKYKVLAYIDPCGMQLNWDSIKTLEKLSVDLWILVPTGLGVNRLLKNDGLISDEWLKKLEVFLGMERDEILDFFYKKTKQINLFGEEEEMLHKEEKAILKSGELYAKRLGELFEYVSNPYYLKNSTNSIMFHFYMATNNVNAKKIANEIIKKYNLK